MGLTDYSFIAYVCIVNFHLAAAGSWSISHKTIIARNDERYSKPIGTDKQVDGVRAKRSAYQAPVLHDSPSTVTEDYTEDQSWPRPGGVVLGQVGGVSVTGRGEVVVFHRGDHVWGARTFDPLNQYTDRDSGPIASPTVLVFHPDTGALLQQWGENMFYLPHGVTIDQEENVWLTDVAMHQVFKFPPLERNERTPLLALGEAFTPGNSAARFCKPTSVAVTGWGDFFVADGYCNSRLVKFNKAGVKIMEIGHSTFSPTGLAEPDSYSFSIPHALTLAEDRKLVCVADRQNGRVLCFDWNNGTFVSQISSPQIGSLVYSVAYSPLQGGLFFLVNGKENFMFGLHSVPVQGFVVSASTFRVISTFGHNLQMPHDLAVSSDARNVYVGEIGPNAVHKYSYNGSRPIEASAGTTVMPRAPQSIPEVIAPISPQSLSLNSPQGTVLPAVLVTCAAILFGAAIVTAALVYSRARRRGCGHCSGRRWMLGRSPAEGFMIGHLLGQHQGFEKLSTGEESEEEVTSLQPFA